ncbi:hypothetical protein DPMN_024172 [Dreissena polymorpha]|uniref:Sushi domain-containing protein n=1 Tax=Dreissena polymorpha TaxID=45954 RepID=A0A9D4LM03_DREPO|nr:hypothetical protein DPMN_024172 [Dreissena polymorpha]
MHFPKFSVFNTRDILILIDPISVKKCSSPPPISFGSYYPMEISGEHEFNTSVNYTCNFGYYKFSGDGVRTCNDSKQWTGATPVCKSKNS